MKTELSKVSSGARTSMWNLYLQSIGQSGGEIKLINTFMQIFNKCLHINNDVADHKYITIKDTIHCTSVATRLRNKLGLCILDVSWNHSG